MITGKCIVRDQLGIHLRPAKELCKAATEYKCSIKLVSKSIISLLGACVKSGEQVEIICDGDNENEAFEAIMSILNRE